MRVLNLSLDKKILEKDSTVRRRLLALAAAVGELTVFVPGERDSEERISEHLTVFSFSGPKLVQFWKMWRKGKSLIPACADASAGRLNPLSLTHPTPPPSYRSCTPFASEDGRSRSCEAPSIHFSPSKEGRGYDLVTVQDAYFLGVLGVKLSEKSHIPLEVQLHGFERFSGLRKKMVLFVLRKATRIRAVSERLKVLAVALGVPAEKVYTLPVYTQVMLPQKPPKRKTVPYPFTFLTVGRLVPVKNISMQICALAELSKKIPHVRLQIVGDGPLMESLKLHVESLKLEDKVVFEGYQEDLERYYEEADAFLLTSDFEGWGRVVLEAAAHKLPIIMTNVGLANEVLHHDKECIVIPVGDEAQLVGAMKEVLDSPELRARLGEAAFRAFKALPGKEEQIEKQVEEWRSFI